MFILTTLILLILLLYYMEKYKLAMYLVRQGWKPTLSNRWEKGHLSLTVLEAIKLERQIYEGIVKPF